MSLSIIFSFFLLISCIQGCPEAVNSFCETSFEKESNFYVSVDGSDDKDCSETEPCGSLQGPFGRGLEGVSNVVINLHPGVYAGAQQSLYFNSANKTNLTILCNYSASSDPCVLDLTGASRFLAVEVSGEDSVLVRLVGLQLKHDALSGSVSSGFVLTRNVRCISVENCSFRGGKSKEAIVGRALALYSTRGNIINSVFDFADPNQSSIVHWEGLYPGFGKTNVVSILNVTFTDPGFEIISPMIDISLSNLNNDTTVSSLYQLNRHIDVIYVCIYVLSPQQINSVYINNSVVGIIDSFPIHMDHVHIENAFSVLMFDTQFEIEIDRLDWYGGYFSLTSTLTITGTSTWKCHMNNVCTPAWNMLYDEIAINISETALLTMTGYYVPQSQSVISIENYGMFHINQTDLIKFDKIINHRTLDIEGDLPFLRYFNQSPTGTLHITYSKIHTWYVAYAYLQGLFWISLKEDICQPHNTSFEAIRYYESTGSIEPLPRDGLNYSVLRSNADKYWRVHFTGIECQHLSCDCQTCHTNSSCTYCAMSHLCMADTGPGSHCPIFMKETCCPNDCNGFSCHQPLNSCQCSGLYQGFDCSEFHWWIVLVAGVVFVIFLSFFVILAIYKCWKRSMKHKLNDLRDHLEEQHNSYVDRIQNRQLPSNLIIDFNEIKIKRSVGCGSFGEVYEGKWRNSVIAVKKIRIRTSGLTQEEKEEFQQEAAIMSKLLHPNIVLLMGVCTEEPNLCLITEYMQKGSVREVLDDHSIELDWKTTIVMALDAAKGMSYLHGVAPPVIHRDLKTANLLVDHNWKVKVADFGVAKMIKDIDYMVSVLSNSLVNMTTVEAAQRANEEGEKSPLLHRQAEQYNTTCAGSLRWCAPESMKPKLAATVYGQKVDIYSYGVILWELATREWPYVELKFDFEVMEHVLRGDRLPIPSSCPSHYVSLMQECWNQDPRYRPWFPDIVNILDDMCKFFK